MERIFARSENPIRDHLLESVSYSSCFKIPEAEHASVASRSGCSRAKPIALPATVYLRADIREFHSVCCDWGLVGCDV
ncbi:MAG: hypothetical protein LBJ00_15765 [Planctomycetaceae bacterium]|nr:hypothetical protein [Planctomycetaceae bacterium]